MSNKKHISILYTHRYVYSLSRVCYKILFKWINFYCLFIYLFNLIFFPQNTQRKNITKIIGPFIFSVLISLSSSRQTELLLLRCQLNSNYHKRTANVLSLNNLSDRYAEDHQHSATKLITQSCFFFYIINSPVSTKSSSGRLLIHLYFIYRYSCN